MTLRESILKQENISLSEASSLPEDLKDEFKRYLSVLNFQHARGLVILLFLANLLLLFSDYLDYRKQLWTLNQGYKLLFYSHIALGVVTGLLILVSIFLKPSHNEQGKSRQAWFAVVTSIFILDITAYISGGIDQLLHQQITVYILGVFSISAFIYLSPKVSFLIYFTSYVLFWGCLKGFQPDYDLVRGHTINGALLTLVAWFLTVSFYRLKRREFLHEKSLEEMVKQRTKLFDETMELEKKLRKLGQEKAYRLASIVESTDDGIIGMDTKGTILYWNPGAERVYGYTQEEIVGKSISMIFHDDRHDELVEIFSKAQKGEKISHLETERRHKNGQMIDVSITVSPIKDELGEVIGVSTILRDISAKKQMERELARLDRLNLIGEMAASISHEVRNPMTTVRGFLQLLYDKEENTGYRSYFDLMIAELDRANAILTEFLSISRTKMTERRRQNLNEIIQSLAPLLEANAVSSNKRLQIEMEELPDLLLDDKETRQVILNLSRNGLEAMDEGGTLTLRTYMKDNEVILEVRDQGHGISPEIIDRLGTPFLTTKSEGTGLGLAICYGIVARHDARIEVKSGKSGSTFYVRYQTKHAPGDKL